jgi:hypothetical protein
MVLKAPYMKQFGDRLDGFGSQLEDIATVNVKNYGIISNGTTDQTSALVDLFTTTLVNFKGNILIPFNTKFNIQTVFSNAPINAFIEDKSMINMYNSESYKQRYYNIGENGRVDNDFITQLISGHHPALVLNNIGTSGTDSASKARNSIIYAHGFNTDGTLKSHMIQQVYNDGLKWIWGLRILKKYLDDETPLDSTIIAFDENGNFGLNGLISGYNHSIRNFSSDTSTNTGSIISNTNNNSTSTHTFEAKKSDGTVIRYSLRINADDTFTIVKNAENLIRFSDRGVEFTKAKIINWKIISGSTPDVSSGVDFFVNNTSVTSITNFINSGNQEIRLIFQNANTTLIHNSSLLRLKGGVNWNPSQYSSITLVKNGSVTGAWIETSRNEM